MGATHQVGGSPRRGEGSPMNATTRANQNNQNYDLLNV